eukprot:m.57146 g.57146  ORF g.57146 m.57146 type:complete len:977 (+) comp13705_c0_seq2:91-3021(+)
MDVPDASARGWLDTVQTVLSRNGRSNGSLKDLANQIEGQLSLSPKYCDIIDCGTIENVNFEPLCLGSSNTPYRLEKGDGCIALDMGWAGKGCLDRIAIRCPTASAGPLQFKVQGSHDNMAWESLLDVKRTSPWRNGERRSFVVSSQVPYRWHRVLFSTQKHPIELTGLHLMASQVQLSPLHLGPPKPLARESTSPLLLKIQATDDVTHFKRDCGMLIGADLQGDNRVVVLANELSVHHLNVALLVTDYAVTQDTRTIPLKLLVNTATGRSLPPIYLLIKSFLVLKASEPASSQGYLATVQAISGCFELSKGQPCIIVELNGPHPYLLIRAPYLHWHQLLQPGDDISLHACKTNTLRLRSHVQVSVIMSSSQANTSALSIFARKQQCPNDDLHQALVGSSIPSYAGTIVSVELEFGLIRLDHQVFIVSQHASLPNFGTCLQAGVRIRVCNAAIVSQQHKSVVLGLCFRSSIHIIDASKVATIAVGLAWGNSPFARDLLRLPYSITLPTLLLYHTLAAELASSQLLASYLNGSIRKGHTLFHDVTNVLFPFLRPIARSFTRECCNHDQDCPLCIAPEDDAKAYPHQMSTLKKTASSLQNLQPGSLLAGTVMMNDASFILQSSSGRVPICPSSLYPEVLGKTILVTEWEVVKRVDLSLTPLPKSQLIRILRSTSLPVPKEATPAGEPKPKRASDEWCIVQLRTLRATNMASSSLSATIKLLVFPLTKTKPATVAFQAKAAETAALLCPLDCIAIHLGDAEHRHVLTVSHRDAIVLVARNGKYVHNTHCSERSFARLQLSADIVPDLSHVLSACGASVTTVAFKALISHIRGSPHKDEIQLQLSSTNSASSSLLYANPRVLAMLPKHLGDCAVICFTDIERKVHESGKIYLRTRRSSALRIFPLETVDRHHMPTPRLLVDMYAAALLGQVDTTAMELIGNVSSISNVPTLFEFVLLLHTGCLNFSIDNCFCALRKMYERS